MESVLKLLSTKMGIKSEQKGTRINHVSQTIKVKSEVKGNR